LAISLRAGAGLASILIFQGTCMLSKPVKLAATATLLLGSSVALAIPFSSFDARSMAMGGAGVAVGDASTAPLFNPALLSMTRDDDHFALVLPAIGVRIADPDKLRDSIDKFQSGNYVNNLQTSVDTLNARIATATSFPTPINISAVQAAAAAVGNPTTGTLPAVSTQLATLSNKPITIDGGVATVIAIPSDTMGAAFYATGTVTTGGLFLYKDAATLQTLADQTNCLAAASTQVAMTACATTYGTNVNFTSNTLQSGINFRGVMLAEMGIAISTYNLGYMTWGITPKVVQAQLFDVPIKVNDSNQNGIDSKDYLASYSMPNFDIGIASYDNVGWRTGLVIKNVIPYTLDFKTAPTPGATPVANGKTLSLKPQARIGVSHTNSWSTVALDYDVTRNDPAGFENGTQYLAFGAELNAFDWVQLRAGYRMDMADSARNVTSVGLGLSPFGIPHIDIAVAGNASEVGASFQFGVHF
jgi:hypothetical protein